MTQSTLQFACPGCQTKLKVHESARGKSIRCPKCQKTLRIPQNSSRPAASVATALPIEPTPTSVPAKPASFPSSPGNASLPDWDSFNFANLELPPVVFPAPVVAHASHPPTAPFPSPGAARVASPVKGATPLANTPLANTPLANTTARPKVNWKKVFEEQLSGKIKKHATTAGYRLAMMLVSLFMMAMPLAYVGLICLTIWGVYHYTFDVFPNLLTGGRIRGRAAIVAMLLYITPIIAGLTTILFMIKPVFVSIIGWDNPRTRSLTREGEPLLFELVDRVCEVTGAPKPGRIDVDAQPNASASCGAGFRGIFRRELVLTIGVPFIAGLTARQFVGVLAHEFGHFAQGAGMRAHIIIFSINAWFAKVVYHRDAIDETLDDMIEDSESAFAIVLVIARFCVTLVRGILWCFMFAAHAASSILSRQMEFDADHYEIELVGSETFAKTTGEITMIGFSYGRAMETLGSLIRKAVLIDDLPRMAQMCRTQMTAQDKQKLWKSINEETTGLFDTHPCSRQRIAAAEKIASPGLFTVEVPARELFSNYDALCRNVTQDFYRNAVGRLIDPSELESVDRHLHLVINQSN
jgi:Zn-dependent protease with chaperone function